jgi:ABC-type glycerol-3-phosphate transport system substrate-binding protein
MKDVFNFKFILTGVFAIAIVAGIIIFALSKASGGSGAVQANLVIWGTISDEAFGIALQNSPLNNSRDITMTYIRKDPSTFDADFVEALADGTGPDVVILREDSVYKERNRLLTIPYKTLTERAFKDTFIQEGEMFLVPDGVLAVPFIVDPLVLYWNRDMFNNALIAQPPKNWDEVYADIGKMTRKDSNANILSSAIALGEWSNITNAKEIISMLLLQAGTPITQRNGAAVESVLNSQFGDALVPSQSAINFYTQFSNPTGANYTWNRSLPNSLNFFLSGNLSMYIGFASELFSIRQKNSNLNFDVTYVPQIRNAEKQTIFAHMYALSIVKQSKQVAGAYAAITALTTPGALTALESVTALPPVRRDLLASRPTDAYRAVFYNSALQSTSWIDPDPNASMNTFRTLITSITSGQSKITDALNRADDELSAELKS